MSREPTDVDEIRKLRRADRRSRRLRWVWRIALTIFVSLAGLATWQTIQWQITRRAGEKRLETVLGETEAADPDWRLDRLMTMRNQGLPPFNVNAAEQAYQAAVLIPRSVDQWQQQVEWRANLKPGQFPIAEQLDDARKQLSEAKNALELARNVKRHSSGGFAITPAEPDPLATLLPKTQELRRIASLLDFDALDKACDGKGDNALDSVHAILASGRGLGDEPTLISMLVRMAIAAIAMRSTERTIGLCEASDGKLAELQSLFVAEAEVPRLVYATRGDRAVFHRMIENIDNGSLSLESVGGRAVAQTFREKLISLPHRAVIPEQQAMFLEFMNRLIDAAKTPYGPQRRATMETLFADIQSVPKAKYPLILLFPAVNKVDDADTRTAATMRATSVALACERFRLKKGRFPNTLNELPKGILPAIPLDPYNGRDVQYRLTDTGAVVYCVGPDETDDEGELDPTPKPGFDIGFQLFTPEHRRKPPLPKPAADPPEHP